MNYVDNFLKFLNTSHSVFHAVNNIEKKLEEKGFIKLYESDSWQIKEGSKYFVTRNDSSVIAFTVPKNTNNISYNITATHSDSPTFKLKPNFEITLANSFNNLNTEMYGRVTLNTWFDKPLSVAGRIFVKEGNEIVSKLISLDKDLLVIPNMPPHLLPDVDTHKFNLQKDLLPIISLKGSKKSLYDLIEETHKIKKDDILSFDLFLYNRFRGCVLGLEDEFVNAPQLDNLSSSYACLEAFLDSKNDSSVNVYACFDNEEIGSRTKQGADSNFLLRTLKRLNKSLGFKGEDLDTHLSQSLVLSVDNAHALHPSFNEKFDPTNRCYLNQGIVIKHNANYSYTSDALSVALFKDIMKKNNIQTQDFTNRSDVRGGGTLGSILSTQVSINSIDIGLPQLAMHSSSETMGTKDLKTLIEGAKVFYNSHIQVKNNKYIIK